jgi:SAM-dependent methyltransferase
VYEALERINRRPVPWAEMTIRELWADPHISERMLRHHLDDALPGASRPADFMDRSVAWMARAFDLREGRRVVDLGCGPGLYTTRLARTGASVTGVDFSPRSIEYARGVAGRDGSSARHVLADYLEWDPDERFDLAVMIYGDYGAMSPEQRRRLLARVDRLLVSDGAFLLDLASMAALADLEETAAYAPMMMDGFWSAQPYHGFLNTFVYPDEQASVDRYEIVEADRIRTFWTWTQYFDPEGIAAELDASGFEVTELLGDVAGAAYDPAGQEFAVVARRRGPVPPSAIPGA